MKNISKEFIKKIRDKDPVLAEKVESAVKKAAIKELIKMLSMKAVRHGTLHGADIMAIVKILSSLI